MSAIGQLFCARGW